MDLKDALEFLFLMPQKNIFNNYLRASTQCVSLSGEKYALTFELSV